MPACKERRALQSAKATTATTPAGSQRYVGKGNGNNDGEGNNNGEGNDNGNSKGKGNGNGNERL